MNRKETIKDNIKGIAHIAIDVTDIETVYQYLTEHNYEITTSGIEFLPFWENGVKFCKITGPNNESIEFSQQL